VSASNMHRIILARLQDVATCRSLLESPRKTLRPPFRGLEYWRMALGIWTGRMELSVQSCLFEALQSWFSFVENDTCR
jgi:hypothetical protein